MGAAPALASTGSGVISSSPPPTIALGSTTAGSAADLNLGFAFTYPASGDTVDDLTVVLPTGMWLAPAAVPATCSVAQLDAHACPAAALIGGGTASLSLAGGLLSGLAGVGAQGATVSLYAMPASGSDLLGIGAVISDAALGVTSIATGSATVLDAVGGAPQVSLSLDGLPQSISGGLLSGLTSLQVDALALTVDGAFIRLPTGCSPATVAVQVGTYAGQYGAATGTVTPTGCPLAFAPTLSTSAARDRFDSGTSFVSSLEIPAADGALGALTLRIPSTLLGPSAKYSTINCPATAPFSGCPAVGTVAATSPLSATPITGTVYLTGTVGDLGVGVSFVAPYALSFTGHLALGSPYVLSFTGLPDIPLTGLALSFPGGPYAAFVSVCSATTTETLSATAAGFGAAAHPLSAQLHVAGCPVAAPPSLAFAFRLSSATHAARVTELKLRLPRGLSFSRSGLRRALKVSGAGYRFKLDHGVLVLALRNAAESVVIRVGSAGVSVGATAPSSPHLGVTVTDKDGKATHLHFRLGLQR